MCELINTMMNVALLWEPGAVRVMKDGGFGWAVLQPG